MSAIYEIFKDHNGHFRFWLIAGNGQLLLTSKAYETKRACTDAVAAARRNAALRKQFELKKAKDGKSYFVLKARNDEPLGRSKYYSSTELVDGAIETVRKDGPQGPINDLTASWH